MQVGGGDGDAAHRNPPGQGLVECGTCGTPQFHVEGAGGEADAFLRGGVVGVAHRHVQPARGVAALAEPAADPLGHRPQQPVQHGAVVGVGGEHVAHATFLLHLRGQHRAAVDAVGVLEEHPSRAPERDAERLLAERGHFADPLEVIVVEPLTDRLGDVGQQ